MSSFQNFQFEHPYLLFLLFLLPLFLWFKNRKIPYVSVTDLSVFPKHLLRKRPSLFVLKNLLTALIYVFIVIALSSPVQIKKWSEKSSLGIDLILAIDTSASMRAVDLNLGNRQVDRLTVVKKVISEFIKGRVSDRIGMVVFGDHAYTQAPPTLDYELLTQYLSFIEIGMAGDGTAIGDAIAISVKRLKDLSSKNKVIILLTDGANTSGSLSPTKAAEVAKELGVKIYAVAVGKDGMAPVPVQTPFGMRMTMQEMKVDFEALQSIASLTGGKAYQAEDTLALKQIYATIDQLEKSEVKVRHYEEKKDYKFYFVALSLACFILEKLLMLSIGRLFGM